MENVDLIDLPKDLAATELARTGDARRTLIDEHSASFRWLVASFLALNSGGLFLLKDVDPKGGLWLATGACFYVGIACALGVAWQNQRANRAGLAQISEMESLWATAASTGIFDKGKYEEVTTRFQAVGTRLGRIFGWSSFLAFTAAVALAGFQVHSANQAPTKSATTNDR